jgi:lipopolysaccharide/colanic/teichoic acid biosynthesis glycosyltransferase
MAKRAFDIILSFIGLLLLSPVFITLAIAIAFDSPGGVFYRQTRVGKNGHPFRILKFRSMRSGSDKKGQLTVGSKDQRITRTGRFIRRHKLDELPQLINVLKGDMSLVGPRPEVPKYVAMYNEEQKKVLSVRPGITDYASIEYANENDLLASSSDPEKTYIDEVMPAKLALNKKYISEAGLGTDIKLIFRTLGKVFR